MDDFVCVAYNNTQHWCNIVQFEEIPTPCKALISHISVLSEPATYFEVAQHPEWVTAMQKEIEALTANHTWVVTDLPKGKKAIGCKWVYKVKLKKDGSLERYKARLVAKGFTQKFGVDYAETFSPVVKMATIRCLLAIASSKQWPLYQLDINNAFLHGSLDAEVYMKMPHGVPNPENKVCKLLKSLYGLKQASRQWFARLTTELQQKHFTQSKNDYSLFIYKDNVDLCIVAVYVDDIILTGTNTTILNDLKLHLHTVFSIKDLGELSYFLGIEVSRVATGIILTQRKFTKELLESCEMDVSKSAKTPLPVNLRLLVNEGEFYHDPAQYRCLVGKLNFLTHTRPDISFGVQTLSQFLQSPRIQHVKALSHMLRYLAGSIGQGILLQSSDELSLQGFSDSDWASCPNTRRSVTGYIMLLGKSPISWKSKKQSTVSRSSSEAEYRALASAASEITWLVRLLSELGIQNLKPIRLCCDNQSAIHLGKNPVHHERTKHVELDCHFTREKVMEGLLELVYIPTSDQLADLLTKSLASPQFHKLLSKLGVRSLDSTTSLRGVLLIYELEVGSYNIE